MAQPVLLLMAAEQGAGRPLPPRCHPLTSTSETLLQDRPFSSRSGLRRLPAPGGSQLDLASDLEAHGLLPPEMSRGM
jgi:hypothetical protein